MHLNEIPVVIPCLQPDETLLSLISQLQGEGIQKILLVDDGSGPAYQAIFQQAEQQGCVVVSHAVNLGKGRALKTAFNECLLRWPDAPGCVTADSDGQHTPSCIASVMEALANHPDSLILGSRDFGGADVPFRSRFGNQFTCGMFRILIGLNIRDTQTGLRGIPASFMETLLAIPGERYEFESHMLMETREQQVPIREIPIQTVYLNQNKSSHFHPLRDSLRIYKIFAKFLFSSLSSSLLDLGLFWVFCRLLPSALGVWRITAATLLARLFSASYNYFFNHHLVFKSKQAHHLALSKYALLAGVQMACSALFVSGLFQLTRGNELVIKILVDSLLFFISFQIQREFVYRKNPTTPAS